MSSSQERFTIPGSSYQFTREDLECLCAIRTEVTLSNDPIFSFHLLRAFMEALMIPLPEVIDLSELHQIAAEPTEMIYEIQENLYLVEAHKYEEKDIIYLYGRFPARISSITPEGMIVLAVSGHVEQQQVRPALVSREKLNTNFVDEHVSDYEDPLAIEMRKNIVSKIMEDYKRYNDKFPDDPYPPHKTSPKVGSGTET